MRSSSLNRNTTSNLATTNVEGCLPPPNDGAVVTSGEFVTPLNPISRIHIGQQLSQGPSAVGESESDVKPLDRPTAVKPQPRSSVIIQPGSGPADIPVTFTPTGYPGLDSPPVSDINPMAAQHFRMTRQQQGQEQSASGASDMQQLNQVYYEQQMAMPHPQQPEHQPPIQHPPPPMPVIVNHAPSHTVVATPSRRMSHTRNPRNNSASQQTQYGNNLSGMQQQARHSTPSTSPEKRVPPAVVPEVVPMNADKPTGLQLDEFLPRKFSGLGLNYNTNENRGVVNSPRDSKFSSYKDYGDRMGGDMSESEVTSSILKGHDAMMAVLTTRGRNMEIIQKLWQGKDAKAGKKEYTYDTVWGHYNRFPCQY